MHARLLELSNSIFLAPQFIQNFKERAIVTKEKEEARLNLLNTVNIKSEEDKKNTESTEETIGGGWKDMYEPVVKLLGKSL